jgi:hypothetical protein
MMDLSQVLGMAVAAFLTALVYTYLLGGDNPLYRLALHLFVGVAVAFGATIAFHSVLVPKLFKPLVADPRGNWLLVVPFVLGLLLLTKAWRSSTANWLGNIPLAFLVGVGAAVAIGGTLTGTLLPQTLDTIVTLAPSRLGGGWLGFERAFDNLIFVIATLGAFLYFTFTPLPTRGFGRLLGGIVQVWGRLGRWFIVIALAAIFANTAMANISLLIGRVQFLLRDWLGLLRY